MVVAPVDVLGSEVGTLDVIDCLADHQQNITPRASNRRTVILALPLPAICETLAPETFLRVRARQLASLAEVHGGGEGPLAIVDLASDTRCLDDVLAEIANDGCEMLLVYGAPDQPGLSRAVTFRWGGGLRVLCGEHATATWTLFDDPAPIAWIEPNVARVYGTECDVPAGAAQVLRALSVEPPREPSNGRGQQVRDYAMDRDRLAAPFHGFAPPASLSGGGDALRTAWLDHWKRSGRREGFRCALLGLDPDLEARLRRLHTPRAEASAPEGVAAGAIVLTVTGLDGSGKSTHAARLANTLRERGLRVATLKIYRQGAFLSLADELSARTRRGAPLAAFRVSRLVKLVDSLRVYRDVVRPALATCDVLVMDRYIETHVAAAEAQLGWNLRESPLLAVYPTAARTFWLRVPIDDALARLSARGEVLSADEHPTGLLGYARVFDALARGANDVVLDSRDSLDHNAARIADVAIAARGHFDAVRTRDTEPVSLVPVKGCPETTARDRVSVVVGGEKGTPLGQDVFGLRSMIREIAGLDAVTALPESLWLEAYAAQLVLDLRTGAAAGSASIAVWPEALRRMPGHRDLAMLTELTHLLRGHARVLGWTARSRAAEHFFASVTATPAAARRLCAAYEHALECLAREEGWTECR